MNKNNFSKVILLLLCVVFMISAVSCDSDILGTNSNENNNDHSQLDNANGNYDNGNNTNNVTTDTDKTVCVNHVYTQGYCSVCGEKQPPMSVNGDKVYFGSYPQTKVTDSVVISSLNALAGELPTSDNSQSWVDCGYIISDEVSSFTWYIDLETGGEKYRGVYFSSYRPIWTSYDSSAKNSYQDENGYDLNTVYWFKYEPISWTVLEKNDGSALILCDMIIDSQEYYPCTQFPAENPPYANNYEYSTIRAWLNDDFYNTAFNDLQKNMILTTTVDNSVESTRYSPNENVCPNTDDKVFLLSYDEAYKYLDEPNRYGKTPTDYAQSQGAYYYQKRGDWWLRSPYSDNTHSALLISYRSDLSIYTVYYTSHGVVPAMTITMN